MSFWLKVRSAIRAGEELLPSAMPGNADILHEAGDLIPYPGGANGGYGEVSLEPVVSGTYTVEPIVTPVSTPQIDATKAEDVQDIPAVADADALDYIDQVMPLADLIGHTEGTDKGRGYNETLGYGAYTGGDVELVKMSLAEIDALQTRMLAHPKNKLHSSALGRFQFIRTTLRTLKTKWGIPDSALFNKQMQNDLFYITLVGRGLVRWRKGQITESQFIDALSAEWASLPNSKGKGTYKGQGTGCSLAELKATLSKIK